MLRRCAARLALFSSGAGTGARLETAHTPPPPTEAEHSTDKDRAVFLPWTVRPWDVTHHAHRSQWKFLDTVLSHLAKVSPAEMHLRVLEQGARDVLCDLEDPAAALRRQQAQQARQRRRHERAAAATAASAAATPAVPASEDARKKPATAAMMAKRKDRFAAATSTVEPLSQRGDDAAYPLDALLSTSISTDVSMEERQGDGTAAASPSGATERQTRSAALDSDEVSTESTAAGEDDGREKRAMARQDEAAPSREKKKLRKRKTSRKAVNVIHYV